MTPYNAFIMYVALRNHFTQKSYDFIKYNGKVNISPDSYNKRKDKWIFEKLARRSETDLKTYLVANFIRNPKFWVGDEVVCVANHKAHNKIQQSLTYTVTNEIKSVMVDSPDVRQLIQVGSFIPQIIHSYIANKISLETLVVFTDCVGCYTYWDKNLREDVIWDHVGLLIKKYKPFLDYDKKKFQNIIKSACVAV